MKRPFNLAKLGKLVEGKAQEVREGEVLVRMSKTLPGVIEGIWKRQNGTLISLLANSTPPPVE